jgi:hypothetical protein
MPRWKFWLYGLLGGSAIIAAAFLVAFVLQQTLLSVL